MYSSRPPKPEGFSSCVRGARRSVVRAPVVSRISSIRLLETFARWNSSRSPSIAGRPSWVGALTLAIRRGAAGAGASAAAKSLSPEASLERHATQR